MELSCCRRLLSKIYRFNNKITHFSRTQILDHTLKIKNPTEIWGKRDFQFISLIDSYVTDIFPVNLPIRKMRYQVKNL